MTYRIVRYFFKGATEVLATECTLEEAQEHCSNPETSFRTAKSPEAVARTKARGPWFDGYEKEDAG